MDFLKVILTSLGSVVILFVIAKIIGHKQLSQLNFFDYITGITIGSIAAELATELEDPWKPLTAMVIYGGVSVSLSLLSTHVPKSRKFVNGAPTVILDNGKLYRKNMKKAKLDLTEFMVMCRQEGYFDLSQIQTAVFENNGKLTVLPVSSARPATPADLNLAPPQEYISAEVILDGRVLDENLQRMGLNLAWLEKQLKAQGYHSVKEIYLGLCDRDKNLSLYPIKV